MATTVEVRNFKCFAQAVNADHDTGVFPNESDEYAYRDYAKNLVGNVLEKVRVTFDVYVSVVSFTESPLVPERNSEGNITGYTPAIQDWVNQSVGKDEDGRTVYSLTRQSGSFIEDGFREGDFFYFCYAWNKKGSADNGGWVLRDNEIKHIASDGKSLIFNYAVSPKFGALGNVGIVKKPIIKPFAYGYAFGLTPPGETPDYLSHVTQEEEQRFFSRASESDGSQVTLKTSGDDKSWVSGDVKIDAPSSTLENDKARLKELLIFPIKYEVEHEFYIEPFFNEEIRLILNEWKPDTPLPLPEVFEGAKSLDYAFELTVRDTLTNNDNEVVVSKTIGGFVGWFNENFNDLGNPIESAVYTDTDTDKATTKIQVGVANPFEIEIKTKAEAYENKTGVRGWATLIRIPNAESEYINTKTGLQENFIIKRIKATEENLVVESASRINTFTFTGFGFSTEQKAKIKRGDKYLLAFSMEKQSSVDYDLNKTSRRAMVIVDIAEFDFAPKCEGYVKTYKQVVNGYADNYQCHLPGDVYTEGDPPFEVFNEDILNVWAQIDFTRFAERVAGGEGKAEMKVEAVAFGLVAENESGDRFEIDRFNMPLPEEPKYPVRLRGLRAYTTEVWQDETIECNGKYVNLAKVNNWELFYRECPVTDTGTDLCRYEDEDVIRQYELHCSQAIRWQDWWRNGDVSSEFFDPDAPANGLNRKASNFSNRKGKNVSNKKGYSVYLGVFFKLSGENRLGEPIPGCEEFEKIRKLIVYDYGDRPDDTPEDFEAKLELFVVKNGKETQVDSVVIGEKMLMRSTYKNYGACNYVIHRIEESKNTTDEIWESSTGYFNEAPKNPDNPKNPLYTNLDDWRNEFPNLPVLPEGVTWARNTVRLDGENENTLISECFIDGTRLVAGKKYKLSSRLGHSPKVSLPIVEQGFLLSDQGFVLTGDGGEKLQQD